MDADHFWWYMNAGGVNFGGCDKTVGETIGVEFDDRIRRYVKFVF